MANIKLFLLISFVCLIKASEDLKDFEFSEPHELLIAQESRNYETVVSPPVRIVKPHGVTNSHRPQYNLDSFEDVPEITKRPLVKNYKLKNNKEGMIKDAVLKALERKDHVGKFAEILPIIRAMSGNQRVALASLVASQVTTPPGRRPLSLSQVRSMFHNETAELMLPILLDTANLIRRSTRPGKEPREVRLPQTLMQRRSFDADTVNDEIDTEIPESTKKQSIIQKYRDLRNRYTKTNSPKSNDKQTQNKTNITQIRENVHNVSVESANINLTRYLYSTTEPTKTNHILSNSSLDLTVEATNMTLVQDMPVAEKLRSLNRYLDRKGNLIRRGIYPKPTPVTRRTIDSTLTPIRRRPTTARTLAAAEQAKCELFTNGLCLHSDDYPTDAIIQSIRRNKAAAGALLADFKDPGEGAIDGITAAQEEKYTADHYLVSNRRGDTSNRDFASAGEAGFMCPSTVKYARPQRARATSGQWKYIVNTGEHTQTLRLEKCLKPKESCTYLTDNFKSKCVQVYNYHRLLTWDQQNGLHMDIFKVPTCCSCHIEGYSVSFPPLGHRVQETSSEHFPGEDLSPEHANQVFESVQSSVRKPIIKNHPYVNKLEYPFTDNSIPDYSKSKLTDEEFHNVPPMDSYGNKYFPDSFTQASSVRNYKRPLRNPIPIEPDSVTLPSYLEPPTPSSSFLSKDSIKYNIDQYKRRPSRRPIKKKISNIPEDLISAGSSSIGAIANDDVDDEFDEELDEPELNINKFNPRATIAPKLHAVTENNPELSKLRDEAFKKVNYNYHPIIDFFNGDKSESIDREDTAETYLSTDSEWKPINSPSDNNTNSIAPKKHK